MLCGCVILTLLSGLNSVCVFLCILKCDNVVRYTIAVFYYNPVLVSVNDDNVFIYLCLYCNPAGGSSEGVVDHPQARSKPFLLARSMAMTGCEHLC
jgi:hypothetical protein